MSILTWLKWPVRSPRVPRHRHLPDFVWFYVMLEVFVSWLPGVIAVIVVTDWSVGIKVAACVALLPVVYVVLRLLHDLVGP